MKDPRWYKGSDLFLFQWLASRKRHILKYVRFLYLGTVGSDVVCENRKELSILSQSQVYRGVMEAGLSFLCSPEQCSFFWDLLTSRELQWAWTALLKNTNCWESGQCKGGRDSFSLPGRLCLVFMLVQIYFVNVWHLMPPSYFACVFVFKEQRCFYCRILAWILYTCADVLRCAAILHKHSNVVRWQYPDVINCIFHNHSLLFISDFPLLKSLFAFPFCSYTFHLLHIGPSVHFWILVLHTRLTGWPCDAVASLLYPGEN